MSGGVSAAVGSGRVAELTALRDRLAGAIDLAEPKELAPLARQFVLVTQALDELREPEEVSGLDQLAARRSARLAGTDGDGGAAEGGQRRRRGG